MIFLRVNVQHWHGDLAKVDELTPDPDLALNEFVALIKVFYELPIRFPDLVRRLNRSLG